MLKKYLVLFVLGLSMIAFIGAGAFLIYQLVKMPKDLAESSDVTVEETESENIMVDSKVISNENAEHWVTNPTSGSKWYVRVLAAEDADNVLVLVPGGRGYSKDFLNRKKDANQLVNKGFTVVIFDPEGRGQNEGEEDDNGTIGQDGLKAIVDFAASIEGMDHVGIVSFSYGVTMASGMLARYPNSPAEFLIDWEGPADREETGGCDRDNTGHLKDEVDCDDEAFWQEREAVNFIKEINVPYLRLQTEHDHAQPDYEHTRKMVNAATGNGPWVRLNEEEPNLAYEEGSLPRMLPDSFERVMMEEIADYALYLLAKDLVF